MSTADDILYSPIDDPEEKKHNFHVVGTYTATNWTGMPGNWTIVDTVWITPDGQRVVGPT